MEQKQKAPVVVSIVGLHGRKRKKEIKRVSREISKDKKFKKALRRTARQNDVKKLPKALRSAVVKAAVEATVGTETEAPVEPVETKKSGLEVYTELVAKFAAARRKNKKRQKKVLKIAKKEGYNPETGLYTLQKADKITLAKKAKPIKPYKPKKVKKS